MIILVHVPIWKKYNLSQFADLIFLDMYFFEHFLILKTEFIIMPGNRSKSCDRRITSR